MHGTGIHNYTCSTLYHGTLSNSFISMCNNFNGPPVRGQSKLASKADVLFYSAWNLLPACGVQSVQGTEGNSTTKSCLKRSAE